MVERKPKDLVAPSPAPAKELPTRRYHVPLTPNEVIERLCEVPGLKAYERQMMADYGHVVEQAEYTLELGALDFTLHCGPPAARGQSATGMLRVLYLRGTMTRTQEGTLLELGFVHRRPRWALQRWMGFLALAGLGLLWVLIGPGELGKKAMLYGILLVVLAPVVVHELRAGDQIEAQRKALLNLIEGSFGSIQLDEPHPDEPYRRRMVAASNTPENT